jgi:Tfp pilus assembly protein PilX
MQLIPGRMRGWARRAPRAGVREDGFTMIAMINAMLISTLLTVSAFAAVDGDQRGSRRDQDTKAAYSAAEAGVNDYLFHLGQDQAYWSNCTNVPAPNAVNQAWNGNGADPRTWRTVPGSSAQYTIELLPANGNSNCNTNNAEATMVDANTGTFKIRVTGSTTKTRLGRRSIVATFRRKGFLDYLYFTDYETSDPSWYQVDSYGRQTNPDLVTWASANCVKYWRQSRGSQFYDWGPPGSGATNQAASSGIFWFDNAWRRWADNCSEINFVSNDQIAGPFHTNDEILVCGTPTFGRNAQDRVEVSGSGWRGNSGCSGNNPTFSGTWIPNAPILTLPPSDSALRKLAVAPYLFTGTTTIRLSGANMLVTNAAAGLNNTSMAFPSNGVVYVQNGACGQGYIPLDPYSDPAGCGNVYLSGSYSGNLTIAAEKDVIVTADTTRSNDSMLGLIANNFIRIYHPVTNRDPQNPLSCTNASGTLTNVTIDAAILSLNHSFTVDNYYCGAALSNLTINGAIGQKFRGPVGRSSGGTPINGYIKKYTYDDRLRFRSPPHFLDPVQSAWRIARYTEQLPPR